MQKTVTHFGLKLRPRKYALNLVRDEFAIINTKPSLERFEDLEKENAYVSDVDNTYTMEWCEKYREVCLHYFDKKVQWFNGLDQDEFNNAVDCFLKKYSGFCAVDELDKYSNVSGYYMMVMDQYKQVYIGKTVDIRRRIKSHWNNMKQFDRTLFPMYNMDSVFSIDFFRALDTTRIYVYKCQISFGVENDLIDVFPRKFSCNRIGGDYDLIGIPVMLTNE